jgi:hypothetical protein
MDISADQAIQDKEQDIFFFEAHLSGASSARKKKRQIPGDICLLYIKGI